MQYKVWQELKRRNNATSEELAEDLGEKRGAIQQALRNLWKKDVVDYRLIESPYEHGAKRKLYYIKQEDAELAKPVRLEI